MNELRHLLKLKGSTFDKQFGFLCECSEVVRRIAIAVALENMKEPDLEKFKRMLLQKTKSDILLDFIISRVPNFESIFKSGVLKFYSDLENCH